MAKERAAAGQIRRRLPLGWVLLSLLGCTVSHEMPAGESEPISVTPADPTPFFPPPLPNRRHGHRGHLVGTEWIVFGGSPQARSETSRDTLQFDRGSGEWRNVALLHHGKNFTGSAIVDGELYAVGEEIERFDLGRSRWEVVLPGARLPRSHAFATGFGNEIFVLGGFPIERSQFQIFDVKTRALRDGPPVPDFQPGDHFVLLATLDGGVHALGGLDHESSDFERRHFRLEGERWVERAPHPTGVSGKFTTWTAHRERLYVFEEEGHVYDPKRDAWTKLADPPPMRVLPAVIGVGSSLLVLGGLEPRESQNEAWIYDIETDQWREWGGAAR